MSNSFWARVVMDERLVLNIEHLGSQGVGVAQAPGGAGGDAPIYVPFALPGEAWAKQPDGRFERVSVAPDRVQPACAHFGECGGCIAQHMSETLYADWKVGLIRQAFAHHGIEHTIAPLWKAAAGSRRRIVLSAQLRAQRVRLGFRASSSHVIVEIGECTIAVPTIVKALPLLTDLLRVVASGMPASALAGAAPAEARVHVLAAENGLDVVIEVVGCSPSAAQRQEMARLADLGGLLRLRLGVSEIFQRGAPVLLIDGVQVPVAADGFVQAVAGAEVHMARLATKALGRAKRIADLFSGLGAFTLPLAKRARVLAVDSDGDAVASLDQAVRHTQGRKPVDVLRRDLFREPLSRGELNAFDGVVFDPPRAGAAAQSEALAKSKVPVVVAVSCNPATLARDLRTLLDGGYRLVSVNPVDQFLYSAHVEVVAVLRR